jgi:hypothetical protein
MTLCSFRSAYKALNLVGKKNRSVYYKHLLDYIYKVWVGTTQNSVYCMPYYFDKLVKVQMMYIMSGLLVIVFLFSVVI